MTTSRAHAWRTAASGKNKGKSWCENCGVDKPKDPAEAARKDCRPTRLF